MSGSESERGTEFYSVVQLHADVEKRDTERENSKAYKKTLTQKLFNIKSCSEEILNRHSSPFQLSSPIFA